MTGLPAWVSAALQSRLENVSRGDLRARAEAISDTYRAGGSSAITRSELDALAYAIVRMPATYAAVHAAFAYANEVVPDFQPESMLDAGAGPGTASWAGIEAWPSVQRTALIDSNPRLLDLARQLHGAMQRPDVDAEFIQGDIRQAITGAPKAEVAMASYALTELGPGVVNDVLAALWDRAERLLVIVEPGTVEGFRRILTCREILIAAGATIVAPCSHEGRCPLAENARWCHFAARLPRTRDHLIAKDASVPFEDEKFSYLVAGRGFGDVARGRRILASPKVSKAGIALTLCAPDHPEERTIERRNKEAYRAAKRLDWGDLAPVETR